MRLNSLIMMFIILLLVSSSVTWPAKRVEFSEVPRPADLSSIIEMIQRINESMLFSFHHGLMKFGPRYTGTVSCNLAAQYIYGTFQDMGLPVEYYDWKYGGFTSRDVVATLNGTDPNSTAEYILCGHYDTVRGAPGADDDGSGSAAVLAIASVLSHYRFNHTIKFITFSGEEVGTYGSFTYAREASYRGDNIVAVLNMDMIGYANTVEGGGSFGFTRRYGHGGSQTMRHRWPRNTMTFLICQSRRIRVIQAMTVRRLSITDSMAYGSPIRMDTLGGIPRMIPRTI